MIAYDGANLIDISGPLQAFEERLTVALIDGGLVRSGAQLAILTDRLADLAATSFDTVILPGGSSNGQPPEALAISAWVRTHAGGIGRLCSICTGAFILANTGLLDDRRATTHWRWANRLRERHPAVIVMEDTIFIKDRNIWTSAGVTAGIDLALALIKADHDHKTTISVARDLVVYLRRSGGQSQYSAPFAVQEAGGGAFSDLHAWMCENLTGDLRVERLAETVGMSPRTFSRAYAAAMGTTPARTVERLRLEAARVAIIETDQPLKDIARSAEIGDEQNLRRLFQRHHGINIQDYRQRFRPNKANLNEGDMQVLLDPTLTAAYIVLAVALAFSPGPDVMFVFANGMRHKAKGAIASALGIGDGSLLHAILAAVGVSAVIAASPVAFEIMKMAGAIYLAWLGIQAIRSFLRNSGSANLNPKVQEVSTWQVFQRGFLTNLANPKVIVFNLALLAQFVSVQLGHVGLQVFLLGCIHNVIGLSFLLAVGLAAGKASGWIARTSLGPCLDGVAGVFFLGLAAQLALTDRPNG